MDQLYLTRLAASFVDGKSSLDDLIAAIKSDEALSPKTAALADASLDLDRARRCGFPEVVFGEGKSVETLARIFSRLRDEKIDVLATRISAEKAELLRAEFPGANYNELARTWRLPLKLSASSPRTGVVAVVTAGSSDRPVAEEARETLDWMGVTTRLVQDVGVAGPHRLPERLGELADADAVVVVAGMEGALPSVVGGFVACPVIGVPTSVGYGANFGGLAALLSMLNSCAANVTVVNIDAGFKAGYVAGLIATRRGSKTG
jgi:NCAIR mutase (PurE)-related protein